MDGVEYRGPVLAPPARQPPSTELPRRMVWGAPERPPRHAAARIRRRAGGAVARRPVATKVCF